MNETNLGSIIKNDRARSIIYAVWFIAGILIGVVQVVYSDPDPEWLVKTFAAWSYLGVPVAALATANSKSTPNVIYAPQSTVENVTADQAVFSGPDQDVPDHG